MLKWLRRMKDWVEGFAQKPYAPSALFVLAFAEASFFPIPPDVLLIAMGVLVPARAFIYALNCTLGSAMGGLFGYYIGFALMESVGNRIVGFYHAEEYWKRIETAYQGEWGVWFLVAAAFTPIPYKVATIAAGATQMPVLPFFMASVIGRGLRFFIVSSLIWKFGAPIKDTIEKYFDKLAVAFMALLILGFVAVKYLF